MAPAVGADPLASLRERLAARASDGGSRAPRPPITAAAPSPEAAGTNQLRPDGAEPTRETGSEPETLLLSDARARYRDIYERMQATSRLAASRITMGDIVAVDGESITIGLPHQIQVEKLAPGTDGHRTLADAVAQGFGRRLTVHCVQMKDVEDRLRAQPTRPSHLLDEALKLGATPVGGQ